MKYFTLVMLVCFASLAVSGCGGGKVESITNSDPESVRSQPNLVAGTDDWPWWSGPNRNFYANSTDVPIEFGDSSNFAWKAEVPGEGHASPIVVGDKVFLAVAENQKTMSLNCYSRTNGKTEWTTELHSGGFMRSHQKNSHASATPACDGENVFTAFMFDNGIQVSSVSVDGKIAWQKTAGKFRSRHGFGSSPVLYKSLVIVAGDNEGSGFLVAFDRQSGEIVWRVTRDNQSSYATPTIIEMDDTQTLVLSGSNKVIGYDPANGEQLWVSEGPAPTTANTVVTNGSLVFAGGGYPDHQFFAIEPSTENVLWKAKVKSYVPSPIVFDNSVIVPQDGGILNCYNTSDGEEIWKLRLGQDLSGSPVKVGQHIYIGGEKGTLYVIDASTSKAKIIAKNKLDSRIMTTPAICGNQIFIRTSDSLYCFAKPKSDGE